MAYEQHVKDAAAIVAGCAVVTLSDTRTEATDKSGRRIRELVEAQGHRVAHYQVIRDDPGPLDELLGALLDRKDVDVVLTNGGTGISRRDFTVGVIERRL